MNSYQWALHIKVSSLALFFFFSTVARLHFWGIFLNDWQHKCTSGLRNQRGNIFLGGGGGGGGNKQGWGVVVPDCQIKLLRFADSRAGKERKRTRERQNAKGGTDFPELRNCSGLHLEYSWAVDYSRADWCTHTHTHILSSLLTVLICEWPAANLTSTSGMCQASFGPTIKPCSQTCSLTLKCCCFMWDVDI